MSAPGLEGLDSTVHATHAWINELDERLGWNNKARAFRLLRAVLHALRDRLQVNEAADLAAQMPCLLRGVYYAQWRPAKTPLKNRSKADFTATVEDAFKTDPLEKPAQAIMTVFDLLSDKITGGEVDDVRHALPEDLRNLWPEPYMAVGESRC